MSIENLPTSELPLKLLYSRDEIASRINELAREIDCAYGGREIVMIGILKGSFLFIADLVRAVNTPAVVDFVRIASYGSSTQSSGIIEIRKDLELPIRGRDILIVEDIVDSGQTLEALCQRLMLQEPASLKICTLVDKRAHRCAEIESDFVGFSMEDGFIVGYGLDLDERYRDLPEIFLVEAP